MLKKAAAVFLMVLGIYWSFLALKPSNAIKNPTSPSEFSTAKALDHLKQIAKAPHFVGTPEHESVKQYIAAQLENLGFEVQIQEGYSVTDDWGSVTKPQNILARYHGTANSKALMLLSHYDSNPFSSPGAADAGSGVVTILEGLRVYLADNKPKNDLLVLISDAEELGLNGADIFVNQHPWASKVGLVLNFEARGSGGPSYMLVETNGGNKKLIEAFQEANPEYPVANSLAYSVYKMLPNDTDLTRFREDANIDGFNFAFIDDHYDYHAALDNVERLDISSLKHQASYLMPLLTHFAQTDLTDLKSESDSIYFNVPLFKLVSYPFSWIFPMLILAIVLFIFLIYYGVQKQNLKLRAIGKGFLAFSIVLVINMLLGYAIWPLLKSLYPQYGEMLHGFTYNGHDYIWFMVFLSIAVCALVYHQFYKPENAGSLLVAPIFFWLLLCTVFAFKLKGASFFIIPVYFALISLFVLARQRKPNILLLVLLALPLLTIISPFIQMFPVGLGLKILIVVPIIITLMNGLLIDIFGFFGNKRQWAILILLAAGFFFVKAHLNAEFTENQPKPNSLVYFYDADSNEAAWGTYDKVLDSWTKNYVAETVDSTAIPVQTIFGSKYGTGFSYTKKTYIKPIKQAFMEVQQDTVIDTYRQVKLFVSPQRLVHRFEVYADTSQEFYSFKINGLELKPKNGYVFANRETNRLFYYFLANDKQMVLEYTVPAAQDTKLTLFEISYDMLENPLFDVPQRPKDMIPKPFVVNDAVIIKKSVSVGAIANDEIKAF